jgi:hypothetical protein
VHTHTHLHSRRIDQTIIVLLSSVVFFIVLYFFFIGPREEFGWVSKYRRSARLLITIRISYIIVNTISTTTTITTTITTTTNNNNNNVSTAAEFCHRVAIGRITRMYKSRTPAKCTRPTARGAHRIRKLPAVNQLRRIIAAEPINNVRVYVYTHNT